MAAAETRIKLTEMRIKYLSHEHELALCDEPTKSGCCCSVCGMEISGSHYRCNGDCPLRVHKHSSCSEIPESIQNHPFHPQHKLFIHFVYDINRATRFCNACGGRCFSRFVYECEPCSFFLDIKCAFLIPKKHNQQLINHPHPLILCNKDNNFCYSCSCCDLPIDGADDFCYVCIQCQGLLHKSCADFPWNMEHPFHPSHPLIFQTPHDYEVRKCGVCSQPQTGFIYRCSECGFYLDMRCASLKPSEGEGEDDHQQLSHPHTLIFFDNKLKFPIPCYACELPLGGDSSICFCTECKVLLHKSCADLPQEIKHLLHPQHTLTLQFGQRHHYYRYCWACLCHSDGFIYECSQCKWDIEVKCALPKPTIMMSKIHHHPLAFNNATYRLPCNICYKSCLTPSFRCVLCNFNQHIHCISTLPPTIKSKHLHSLTLTNSPIKDYPDEDDNNEFYCDACEEKRVLAHPSYYCKECHYVAHPHCVASEIIHVLEEEWSKQGSHACANEVEEPQALTLKEFLDSFNEDENKEVQALFEAYRRDNQGHSNDFPKASLNLDKAFTMIMKMLVSENKVEMPWENWDSTSKIIKVDKYMITENWAPILKALFAKYGDFSESSGLSPKAKMLYIMTVCDAVHNMCNTKIVDITKTLLLKCFHSFMLGQYVGFELEFAFDHLTRTMRAHFGLRDNQFHTHPIFGHLGEDIAKLEKALEEKRALYSFMQECGSDAVRLSEDPCIGEQMASMGFL